MKKVGLDCGHGLNTAGKQSPDGVKEWTLNDKVRDKVIELLSGYDVEIINTDNNEGNKDENLTERKSMYVNQNVDAFVSIHHNAFTGSWNDVTGVEIYTDRKYTEADEKLANAIYKNLPNYTGLKGRGVKRSNWTVINQNQIPAVLVEGGFMDSNNDYKVITSEQGQLGYAKAIAEGLIEFLSLTKKVIAPQETKPIAPQETSSNNGLPNLSNYKGSSIVDGLNSVGYNSSFASRKELATKLGIANYTGTAEQNTLMLRKLKGTSTFKTYTYYPACSSKYTSIVDALKSIGVDSSFAFRKKIAQKNNVRDYEGRTQQNNQLLSKLKAGKLIRV